MRLVVVGGGAGGMSAAAQARRTAPDLEIVVLEETDQVSVGLCGLPYFVAGRVQDPRELVVYTPEYFRRERGIQVQIRHRVESVHPGSRTLVGRDLERGEPFELKYDRLVVATGARPLRLPVAGAELPHVHYLRTLADAIRLRAALEQRTARRAAVIGAGYIGLELAEALSRWNLPVAVIEAAGRPLPAFDPWVAGLVANELQAHGIRLYTGHTVTGIGPDAVSTREGGEIPADLVVVAVGNQPALELLQRTGAERGRTGALAVSRQMQTSLPFTWAAGDCAESRLSVTGRPVHLPLGTVANLHGRIVGEAAAGRRAEAPPLAGTYLLQLFDLALARTGLTEAEARQHGFQPVAVEQAGPVRLRIFPDTGEFRVRLVADARTGRLLGATLAGHRDAARRIDVVAALLVRGAGVQDLAGLDLGYTPPLGVARDALVQAAQRLAAQLETAGGRSRWPS